ncbi:MAG TPA: hypothetical protein VGE01_14460 [Fimbriimonas sp.]
MNLLLILAAALVLVPWIWAFVTVAIDPKLGIHPGATYTSCLTSPAALALMSRRVAGQADSTLTASRKRHPR